MNEQTYTTKVVFDQGCWLGADNPTNQPADYVKGLPDRIWGPDSFEWILECYENSSTALDLSSATCTIHIAQDVAGATQTQIGTGTVSGANNNIVTFAVEKEKIPSALYGKTCIVVAKMISGTTERTAVQRLQVTHTDAGLGSTSAGSLSYTPADSSDWDSTPSDVGGALDELADRVSDVEDDANSDWILGENDDIDTGTEVVDEVSVDATCAATWLAWIAKPSAPAMRTMWVTASLLKSPDGYGGYDYTVSYTVSGPSDIDSGSVIPATVFSVAYDETNNKLQLKATVDSDDWAAAAQRMTVLATT